MLLDQLPDKPHGSVKDFCTEQELIWNGPVFCEMLMCAVLGAAETCLLMHRLWLVLNWNRAVSNKLLYCSASYRKQGSAGWWVMFSVFFDTWLSRPPSVYTKQMKESIYTHFYSVCFFSHQVKEGDNTEHKISYFSFHLENYSLTPTPSRRLTRPCLRFQIFFHQIQKTAVIRCVYAIRLVFTVMNRKSTVILCLMFNV